VYTFGICCPFSKALDVRVKPAGTVVPGADAPLRVGAVVGGVVDEPVAVVDVELHDARVTVRAAAAVNAMHIGRGSMSRTLLV
jgi:hypothetical protein